MFWDIWIYEFDRKTEVSLEIPSLAGGNFFCSSRWAINSKQKVTDIQFSVSYCIFGLGDVVALCCKCGGSLLEIY